MSKGFEANLHTRARSLAAAAVAEACLVRLLEISHAPPYVIPPRPAPVVVQLLLRYLPDAAVLVRAATSCSFAKFQPDYDSSSAMRSALNELVTLGNAISLYKGL